MFVFKAAVVGAGTMGGQIAQTIAAAGIDVVLKDVKQEFVDKGLEEVRNVTQGQIGKLVEKEKITGTQSLSFAGRQDDRVLMTLELRYALKERPLGPLSTLVDVLFILPRQRDALQRTLARFGRELATDRELAVG